MSVAESLHEAHKARLRRFEASAKAQASAPATKPGPAALAGKRIPSRYLPDREYERAWAAEILGVVYGGVSGRRASIVDIQRVTARHFDVALQEMIAGKRRLSVPRHIAMYLSRELTRKSHTEIGRMFADKDHSTVLYAIRAIEARLPGDPDLAAQIAHIRRELRGEPP